LGGGATLEKKMRGEAGLPHLEEIGRVVITMVKRRSSGASI
jgi:hypothetical protein